MDRHFAISAIAFSTISHISILYYFLKTDGENGEMAVFIYKSICCICSLISFLNCFVDFDFIFCIKYLDASYSK